MIITKTRRKKRRAARGFRDERIPKFLGYFERVLAGADAWLAAGERWSYADLSLFYLIDGLLHAFPRRMCSVAAQFPKVMALHRRVAHLPELQSYFSSGRRLPFADGIFRHYPELDGE